jgi:hypothetical protein
VRLQRASREQRAFSFANPAFVKFTRSLSLTVLTDFCSNTLWLEAIGLAFLAAVFSFCLN